MGNVEPKMSFIALSITMMLTFRGEHLETKDCRRSNAKQKISRTYDFLTAHTFVGLVLSTLCHHVD